jgi:tryptophan synthase beta chain
MAYLNTLMPATQKDELVVINCSGRGDKDMGTISNWLSEEMMKERMAEAAHD